MQNEYQVTIVSGTNRKGSNTHKIAMEYQRLLKEKGIDAGILSLVGLDLLQSGPGSENIEEKVLTPSTHFIFIIPEYNGSFPGVLKMLIDNSSPHGAWHNKRALLAGVATGRAGNLRGMDHLASILNHIRITVHPSRLPISVVDRLLAPNGRIIDPTTLKAINAQLDDFISWGQLQPHCTEY